MRRPIALIPVFLSAAALIMLAATVAVPAPSAARQLLAASPCTLAPTFEHPAAGSAGAEIPLTLTLKAGCPAGAYGPLHIALLVEASASFARNPDTGEYLRGDVQTSIKSLIDRFDLPNNPWIKIGLVQYNDRPQKLCDLTNDKAKIVGCVDDLAAKGETRLDTSIKEAVNILKRGRPGAGPGLREFVLLFSDGANDYTDPRTSMPPAVAAALAARNPAQQPTAGCDSVVKETDAAKTENPDLIWATICVKCELSCLRRIATSQQYMGDLTNPDRLYTYLDRTADQMGASPLAQLDVTTTLGAGVTYVPESAGPPPAAVAPDNDKVSWKLLRTRDSERIRWSVRAAAPGAEVALCASLTATFIDNRAGTGTLNIDCPTIRVTGGSPPTNTPRPTDPPSSTPEVSETPVPSAVPTDRPTATATTSSRHDIYLPVSDRQWTMP